MKAIVVKEVTDDLTGVQVVEVDRPATPAGRLCVQVAAVALNPVDWKLADGTFPGVRPPHILGLDAAGIVAEVGAGVTGFSEGDRVVWHANLNEDGVFADYAFPPPHVVATVPATVDLLNAAAVPCAGYTAYQGLFRKAHLAATGASTTVLVQGASGGVGGFAVQLAASAGATVIALARPEKANRVKALGAHHVLDYHAADLLEQVRALTPDGQGVDIMFEVVNPGDARRSLDFLAYNGHLIAVNPLPDLSHTPPFTYAASIHEVALGGAYGAAHKPSENDFANMGKHFMAALAAGTIDPMIEHRISFSDIPAYLSKLRAGGLIGKIVAQIN